MSSLEQSHTRILKGPCSNFLYRTYWVFSQWPGLPSPVDPEPLIGITPCVIFDHTGEAGCILTDVLRRVPHARQLNGRLEAQAILAHSRVPKNVAGDDGGSSVQRKTRQRGCRRGRDAVEINEDTFFQ